MRKYISHKYTLAPPFSLTYIPWPWIMPPLSCENLGRLPYLSEPHFFGKWGSHVFGSGVGLERCMNFPGSGLRTCQEVGVHWKLSDRGTGCSPVAHLTLSVNLFFSGRFRSSAAWCGSSRRQPLTCSLPPACGFPPPWRGFPPCRGQRLDSTTLWALQEEPTHPGSFMSGVPSLRI